MPRTVSSIPQPSPTKWRKSRKRVRDGLPDLAYLPAPPAVWDATLTACAYAARREIEGEANLNSWAVMNGIRPSARFEELGRDAVVLWHGTAAYKVPKILRDGFRPVNKHAVYTSSSPSTSHGYTRFRSQEHQGGSAMFCLVIPRRTMVDTFHYEQGGGEVRLYSRVSPEFIEYVLWSDRVDFAGETPSRSFQAWPRFRFKRRGGEWTPVTNRPVRFDNEHGFDTKAEWLDLSIRRILDTLGEATGIEIFASLYSTIEPWHALEHEEIFKAMDRLCTQDRKATGMRLFSAR